MIPFETEFPVHVADPAAFVAQVIAWLRGMKASEVLSHWKNADHDKDFATIRASNGETLILRVWRDSDVARAIGFRHEIPDLTNDRSWRTEVVLRWNNAGHSDGLMRLRTNCLPLMPGAVLDRPKKSYLIKAFLGEARGGSDGLLQVSDSPIRLPMGEDGLETAEMALKGEASEHLPILYVSASSGSKPVLTDRQISKLAFDLGGITHVLLEPDSSFSFALRDRVAGQNPYGGTLGLIAPGQGMMRRLYLGPAIADVDALVAMARESAIALRCTMPARGWDWTELQDAALSSQRQRDRTRLTDDDLRRLYEDEIDNLKDRIEELVRERDSLNAAAQQVSKDSDGAGIPNLSILELYAGEVTDRLRFAAQTALNTAERDGIGLRTRRVLEAFLNQTTDSTAKEELDDELAQATKDPDRLAERVVRLLVRHGYTEKSDNRHIRLEAKEGYIGLETLTVMKTPSDYRGMKNLRSQVRTALGI